MIPTHDMSLGRDGTRLVEAAGVEPDPDGSTNRLMTHDFRRKTLIPRLFPPSIESPGAHSCPLESTPVVEIFWRQGAVAQSMSLLSFAAGGYAGVAAAHCCPRTAGSNPPRLVNFGQDPPVFRVQVQLVETFELAEPGQSFAAYTEARLRRQR